jgi:hypothetical protein
MEHEELCCILTYTNQTLYISQSREVVTNDDFQAASQNASKLIKSKSHTHRHKKVYQVSYVYINYKLTHTAR